MISIIMNSFWFEVIPKIGILLQQETLNANEIIALITSAAAAINVAIMAYQAWKKNKPEIKKIDAEGDSVIVDAAHTNLQGAEISTELLISRVKELKAEIEEERKARKLDADYFRRRIKDIEKEARDYRLWAARLAKQVIEVGKVPVPFISSLNDSDPLISAITREQQELALAKDTRVAELGRHEPEEAKDDTK